MQKTEVAVREVGTEALFAESREHRGCCFRNCNLVIVSEQSGGKGCHYQRNGTTIGYGSHNHSHHQSLKSSWRDLELCRRWDKVCKRQILLETHTVSPYYGTLL